MAIDTKDRLNSFVEQCRIYGRDDDGPLFVVLEDGTVMARLKGYVIAPRERFTTDDLDRLEQQKCPTASKPIEN